MSTEFNTFALPRPRLAWDSEGAPESTEFGDRYFSLEGGAAESEYVFLQGNNLPEAWAASSRFVIAELGFGTALNFLLTLQSWRNSARASAKLFYISCEFFPLDALEISRALSQWPELDELKAELLSQLPPRVRGLHTLTFAGGVTLQLYYTDALDGLRRLSTPVNAWYLDGFAPSKNTLMWSDEIFGEISRLSLRGSTLATFSASADVRRRLEANGFVVSKRKGFGRKREMLTAVFQAENLPKPSSKREKVLIIGGGLAGAATAAAFSKRGAAVTLIEQGAAIAQGASGNTAGVLMPHLSVKPDLMSRFYLSAYLHALGRIAQLSTSDKSLPFSQCGVLRLNSSDRLTRVWQELGELGLPPDFAIPLTKLACSELVGFDVQSTGVYFPSGAWASPSALTKALLESDIQRELASKALSLTFDAGNWLVRTAQNEKTWSGDTVVLCCGYELSEFPQTAWFPLEKVRGQAMNVPASTTSALLRHVVCYDGYLLPAYAGQHFLGATYDHENDSTLVDENQNKELFAKLNDWVQGLELHPSGQEQTRVSFRSMSRDRLPLCGPVPDVAVFEAQRKEVLKKRWEEIGLLPGLYANVGHGSRGLLSCLLGAEIIAAHAYGEPLPIEDDVYRAVHPSRFLARLLLREETLSNENLRTLKVPHLR